MNIGLHWNLSQDVRVELGSIAKLTPSNKLAPFARKADTGIGIPSDMMPHVFEPFFQVEQGTTRRYPGIGLGLAITRDLANAMNGEVRIESTAGKRTTISLLLPAG
jgi:signal transduction histidine kinase